jgi:4-amino-4-deoxy-L-arabinose transferase-like glycosyltransferase
VINKREKSDKWGPFLLFLILVVAFFLRFYKISELHFFTYDQARDDLIAERIIVDRKWTLLGPQSSIGGVYLPPFYYYTIAFPLWFFNFNPVGVDIYTASVGVVTVFLVFLVARLLFGKQAGIFAAALYATSPIIVELSRRAWNPNTLPFFSLLTLFLGYQLWKTKETKYIILMSFAFGYTLSLHYGAFCLLPAVSWLWFDYFLKKRKFWPVFTSILIIFLFFLPLLIFEFRHNFILLKSLSDFFLQKGPYYLSRSSPSFLEAAFASVYEIIVALLSGYFLKGVSGSVVPYEFAGRAKDVFFQFSAVSIIAHKPLLVKYYWWGEIIFLAIIIFSVVRIFFASPKDRHLLFIWGWFITAIIVSRLYRGRIYFFYYLFLYPLPFLLWSGLINWVFRQKRWLGILTIFLFLIMVGINFRQSLIYEKSGRTIGDIKAIARTISDDVESRPFNLAASYKDPDRWDHHALDYRYFVEAYFGKRPLDWYPEDYRRSEILYFISEGKIDDPLASKIMEVQEFSPKKLVKSWSYQDEIFVYKLAKN